MGTYYGPYGRPHNEDVPGNSGYGGASHVPFEENPGVDYSTTGSVGSVEQENKRGWIIVLGWIMAFAWPPLAMGLNYLVVGDLNVLALLAIAFVLGPVFFLAQAIVNACLLALPKRMPASFLTVWIGMATWWVGSFIVGALGGGLNTKEFLPDGRIVDAVEHADTFDAAVPVLLGGAVVACVGYVVIFVGIYLAVRDADQKRLYWARNRQMGNPGQYGGWF